MAAKKKVEEAVTPRPVDTKALKQVIAYAAKEKRLTDAHRQSERALSEIVHKADELASLAGDIDTNADALSPIEAERQARRVERLDESLDKVLDRMRELVSA